MKILKDISSLPETVTPEPFDFDENRFAVI